MTLPVLLKSEILRGSWYKNYKKPFYFGQFTLSAVLQTGRILYEYKMSSKLIPC